MRRRTAGAALAAAIVFGTAALSAQPYEASGDPPLNVGFRQVAVAEGLEHPWSIAWLPDGTALVTERPGRLRAIRNGRLDPEPISGTPPVLVAPERGLVFQSGLFEVSPHPNFAENRLIYLTYAHGTAQDNRLRLARAKLEGNALSDLQVIFEVSEGKPEFQHYGGKILWLPDGTLLLSVGDGGNPPVSVGGGLVREKAQDLNSHFGKILRLRDDGSAPPDNPFAGRQDARPEIFSYGHRHVQGLARHPDGRIFATEHGPLGGDELNLVRPGQNYGWPVVSWGRDYVGGTPIGTGQRSQEGMADPVLVWTTSVIGASGLAVYDGERFPDWRGSVLAGGLATQDIRRVVLDDNNRVTQHESLRIGQRVREVRQGPDGHIYVLTDEIHGRVFRLEPAN
ncbi:PQQ-dependent sugar dehydrogenase [Crenalkalicoccus roseus]|uniref:PQQ-dependent sugar dehydrogenase n=1 Tax=Crenalkalicoccus roseus TaxID=1485588 RepID=UPI0010807608|nr:PQQ-dependent sugar dehydrogenase [Crenalkalicoccus roseus]